MSYVNIALLLLKLVAWLVDIARTKKDFSAGEESAIAKASAEILLKTKVAKATLSEVMGLSEQEVDDKLKDLEPK